MHSLFSLAFAAFAAYLLALAVYRLYLSPLARFPGPKLAALTRWYEFYFEIIKRGQFTSHISDLHKQYGPIVRITPHELHVADSKFWNTLYGPGRTDKYDVFQQRQNIPRSIFATPESDLHKLRKAPLLPLFSKQRISEFQPVIREKLDTFCSKIDQYVHNGKSFKINRALTAFSGDVITTYVFGEAYNHLQSPDFKETFHEPFMAASEAGHMANQFHWLWKVMESLPDSLVMAVQPIVIPIIRLGRDFEARLEAIQAGTAKENPDHPTILYELVRSDLPPSEKTISRLNEEAQLLIAAGLTTAAWAMSVTTFYIVQNKSIYTKLRSELDTAIPDSTKPLSLQAVEKLPFLNACIREGLRLSYGVSARNPRLWPKSLQYAGWTIPPRTPVSCTIVDHNHNEEIFPDSWTFKPERWLDPSMEQWFFSFGKGSRSCLGINLAMAEMHMCLSTLFRRYQFELFETDESDVKLAHDFFLVSPKLDSKGVRVTVREAERLLD